MKYKVGDKVKIKSLDWYNENKNNFGKVWCANGSIPFDSDMRKYCGKVMTISHDRADHYTMVESLVHYRTDEMIEGLVEDIITTNEQLFEPSDISLEKEMEWNLPDGYIFKDENGNVINATKIVLEKKKKEYPKTYEECYKIMGVKLSDCYIQGYKSPLLEDLQELLICRDAYWKIAGEEMGLNRPWKPTNGNAEKVYSIVRKCGTIKKNSICDFSNCYILEFPIKEMRDAFYDNFNELMEFVKELL